MLSHLKLGYVTCLSAEALLAVELTRHSARFQLLHDKAPQPYFVIVLTGKMQHPDDIATGIICFRIAVDILPDTSIILVR